MTVPEILSMLLMFVGALFVLLASVGVVRLPDVYCRLSATSKAVPFGTGLILAGAATALADTTFALLAIAVTVFLALTAPITAHALGRAAHRSGVAPCPATRRDELPLDPRTMTSAAESGPAPRSRPLNEG